VTSYKSGGIDGLDGTDLEQGARATNCPVNVGLSDKLTQSSNVLFCEKRVVMGVPLSHTFRSDIKITLPTHSVSLNQSHL